LNIRHLNFISTKLERMSMEPDCQFQFPHSNRRSCFIRLPPSALLIWYHHCLQNTGYRPQHSTIGTTIVFQVQVPTPTLQDYYHHRLSNTGLLPSSRNHYEDFENRECGTDALWNATTGFPIVNPTPSLPKKHSHLH